MRTPESYLEQSYKRLAAAGSLLENGFLEDAYSRLYYAAFDAARAALKSFGHNPPKRHKGVRRLFHLHVVKEGRLSPPMSTVLDRFEGPRIEADYGGLDDADIDEAREDLGEVASFVEAVREQFVPHFDAPGTSAEGRHRGPAGQDIPSP